MPTRTSRHTFVRQEIHILSKFFNKIREDLSSNYITQNVKHDLQKILEWFIIDYFSHNLDFIKQARKNFRPQNTNDGTLSAEQSDYVWNLEWSHESFLNIPTDISGQAINTISIHKDYVRVYPFTVDTLLVVSTPEQFELNLEYSCYHSGTKSRKPVYTRSIETRIYKSKIKIGIRLRSCTNLSGRK